MQPSFINLGIHLRSFRRLSTWSNSKWTHNLLDASYYNPCHVQNLTVDNVKAFMWKIRWKGIVFALFDAAVGFGGRNCMARTKRSDNGLLGKTAVHSPVCNVPVVKLFWRGTRTISAFQVSQQEFQRCLPSFTCKHTDLQGRGSILDPGEYNIFPYKTVPRGPVHQPSMNPGHI